MRLRNRLATPLLGLLLALGACEPDVASVDPGPAQPRQTVRSPGPDSLALEPLARGLAVALRDEGLSRRLFEDLRDSPFTDNVIHAASYLAGPRGRPLLEAASRASGVSPAELLALAARTPDLALSMPVKLDRITWQGTPGAVVTASARTRSAWAGRGSAVAFDGQGDAVTLLMDAPPPAPVIAILRSDASFGANPEGARARAPRQQRVTLSTREQTYGRGQGRAGGGGIGIQACPPYEMSCICYENPNDSRCAVGQPYDPGGEATPSSFDNWSCRNTTSYVDYDADGLADQCEYEVAHALRPYLATDPYDSDLRREPYWAMYPSQIYSSVFQIVYALSYYYDYGVSSLGNDFKHQGDSEFVVLRVKYLGSGKWGVVSAFLSAHWGTIFDSSEDISFDALEYAGRNRGRPKIWVALDKHGNFRSREQCDRGADWTDTCDRNTFVKGSAAHEVEVLHYTNLGNNGRGVDPTSGAERWYPGLPLQDCVASRVYYFGGRRECYWTRTYFYGWQDNYDGWMDGTHAHRYADALERWLYW